jgi:anaerobic selenocysteine-containing dehydrogenase
MSQAALDTEPRLGPEDQGRANLYALLARLFSAGPDQALLDALAGDAGAIEGDSELARAWRALCQEAARTDAREATLEFDTVFVGVGKASARSARHCSVGCAIDAVVENGVWVRQEPVFDSPINLGAHCAKGAAVREHGHGEHRLKYPMKLVNGKYQRISWDRRSTRSATRCSRCARSGPDACSGRLVQAQQRAGLPAAQVRVAFWGTNNCDHQARICHSTTVAGVANTWGYGAMTNSYNDMQNTKCALYIGSNAAEAHPVSMLHMLHAKENGCKMIVVDPRFTRTAAKADEYVRIRSGTDIPFLFGVLYHIFKNGWEDKQYINDRVYGMDKVREEVMAKWTPDKVEEVPACRGQVKVAEMMAKNRPSPSSGAWARRSTRSATRWCAPRASCSWRSATSACPAAAPTSSAATTTCRARPTSARTRTRCPATTAWPKARGSTSRPRLGRRLRVDQEAATPPGMMDQARHDGVALDRRRAREERELIDQDSNLRRCSTGATRPTARRAASEMKRRWKKLDLLVVVDPYPVGHGGDGAMPAQGRRVPAAGGDAVRDLGLVHRVEPLDPVAREGDRAAVRVAHRPHDHVPAREEARLREGAGQELQDAEGQGRHGRAGARGHPARDQPRRLDHRLHRPVARAPEGCTCATCTSST